MKEKNPIAQREQAAYVRYCALDVRLEKAEIAILLLQNRLPVWATIVMTLMGLMIGALLGKKL